MKNTNFYCGLLDHWARRNEEVTTKQYVEVYRVWVLIEYWEIDK